MKFSLIAAVDKHFGIGKNNTLPWRLPSELKHFATITTSVTQPNHQNAVIMGRKTWDSLPQKAKPLPRRLNVVLSKEDLQLPHGVILAHSLEEALQLLKQESHLENVFVIGGGKVFEEAIQNPACQTIHLTQIDADFGCDTFFPESVLAQNFIVTQQDSWRQENELRFQYLSFTRK